MQQRFSSDADDVFRENVKKIVLSMSHAKRMQRCNESISFPNDTEIRKV